MTRLPVHPFLRHPHTGRPIQAVGWFRGRPIWPVMGASPDDPEAGDPPPDPPADPVDALGDAGKKALDAEREARKAAEKELARYRKAEKERADADRTEAEKRAAAEAQAAESELRAMRIEVAFDKGLTPAQAKRLVGSTREELEADAAEILRDFPVKSSPKPDGSQGSRGGNAVSGRDKGIEQARKRFGDPAAARQ